jgi:Putative peptidoglycan binding domain
MKYMIPFALAAAISLSALRPVAAARGSGSGSHGSASFHGSSDFHAPAGSFHSGGRNSAAHSSSGSDKAATIALAGHRTAAPADPSATNTSASNNGSSRPTSGWNTHWDRIWHGRHYHWNNGAWAIINDGDYPWDDSYYFPAAPDVYPDMSYEYNNTAPDAGAPNAGPDAVAPNPAPGPGAPSPASRVRAANEPLRRDTIAVDVQQSLASHGYYDGPINGIVGDSTHEAIADFQKDNQLQVTGYITMSLLKALGL